MVEKREKRLYWTKRQRLYYLLSGHKPKRFTKKQMKWLRLMKYRHREIDK
jgi:hypothetical protein